MKKLAVMVMGVCAVFALSSCKSSESAYKKAYEKAKQQELAQQPVEETPVEVEAVPVERTTPVVPVSQAKEQSHNVRQEKVTVMSGNDTLKAYGVVCGSFGLKANAERLKEFLDNEGYSALVVFNADKAMYRVVVSSFDDRDSAANARDQFKAKYPSRKDFQGAWLLYRVY